MQLRFCSIIPNNAIIIVPSGTNNNGAIEGIIKGPSRVQRSAGKVRVYPFIAYCSLSLAHDDDGSYSIDTAGIHMLPCDETFHVINLSFAATSQYRPDLFK